MSTGLSRVSVSLPYSSVISLWDKAGNTDTERRTGYLYTTIHQIFSDIIHNSITGFVELLQRHIKKILGFKLEVYTYMILCVSIEHDHVLW